MEEPIYHGPSAREGRSRAGSPLEWWDTLAAPRKRSRYWAKERATWLSRVGRCSATPIAWNPCGNWPVQYLRTWKGLGGVWKPLFSGGRVCII